MHVNGRNSYKVQYKKKQHRRPFLTVIRAICCGEIAYNCAIAAVEGQIQWRTIVTNRAAQFFGTYKTLNLVNCFGTEEAYSN